jgi:hypothetical protein
MSKENRCICGVEDNDWPGGYCVSCSELRDRFASAALTGLLANHQVGGDRVSISSTAYGFADAMLAERVKGREK